LDDKDLNMVDATAFINKKNQETPIMLWSRSWCPYSDLCKTILKSHEARFDVVELDKIGNLQNLSAF
jgi:hypothetical protein